MINLTPQIIHDSRNPDRIRLLMDELTVQGINDAIIWEAVTNEATVEASINKSHKDIVRWAQERGLEEVCIMEDDVMFQDQNSWKTFMANKPADFDLYMGGAYGMNRLAQNRIAGVEGAAEIQAFQGFHCYVVKRKFYEKYLSVPDTDHIDVAMAGLGLFYVCMPMVAYQRPGHSATAKKFVNYNL